MRIAVIGTGGVGGFYGGVLARAGLDVTFVARGAHYDAICKNGLTVKSVNGDFTTPVKVVSRIADLQQPDLILICTKTYHLKNVAVELKSVVQPKTIVLTTQNGLDADLQVAQIVRARVHPGIAYIVSANTSPGVIEQTAGPRTLMFGSRDETDANELTSIAEMMRTAGLEASYSTSIETELWTKFAWIASFAGSTALRRSAIGPIVSDPAGFELITRCLDEVFVVATHAGVNLSPTIREQILTKFENYRHTGTTAKSSLLIDIENNRPTEVEAIHGKLIQLAEEYNVNVPINREMYSAARSR